MKQKSALYEAVVPLSKERHGTWSVTGQGNYGFAAGFTSLPILQSEFAALAQFTPVVFGEDGPDTTPMAIVGLRQGQNVYVRSDGTWIAPYVPACLRRYPFVLASSEGSADLSLCIDEASPLADRTGKAGARLFEDDGTRTPALESALALAVAYLQDSERTKRIVDELAGRGLLESASITLPVSGQENRTVIGFRRVSRDRLKALSRDTITGMFEAGTLELIYLHLFSLDRFDDLARRCRRLPAA